MIPNKEYLLTICIPTYNRGDLLKETLESIVQQATEDIEIVILDSGSTDNTSEVVKHYQRTNTRIKYHYNNVKRGIDVDMSATVEFANGEYCWLLSDDDPLVDNALETVKEALNSKCEIYLCNRIMCDASLNPIKNGVWTRDGDCWKRASQPGSSISVFPSSFTKSLISGRKNKERARP